MHAKVIKVSTVEGKNIKTLIKFEIDRKPQNIVLDPQSGYAIIILIFFVMQAINYLFITMFYKIV